MKKLAVLLTILVVIFSASVIGEDEVKVPFSAIKSSCYGEIDMTKAEFALSEVGKECISEDWLEKNLPSDSEQERKTTDEEQGNQPEAVGGKEIAVPQTVIGSGKLEDAKKLKEEQGRENDKVKVPVSWVKDAWLEKNRPKLAQKAIEPLLEDQPSLKEVEAKVNTPRQLIAFMNGYFKIEFHTGTVAYSPEKFLEVKKGDCKDWAVFAAHILKKNGYDAKVLNHSSNPMAGGHVIAIWKNARGNYSYLTTLSQDGKIYWEVGQSIDSILTSEVERLQGQERVFAYAVYDPSILNSLREMGPKLAEASLEKVLHLNETTLGSPEIKDDSSCVKHNFFEGTIVKKEEKNRTEHQITAVVNLSKIFVDPPRKFILLNFSTDQDTRYTYYDRKEQSEEKISIEKVRPGTKALFYTDKEVENLSEIKRYSAFKIMTED